MARNVAIVDYGVGNLFSVLQACEKVGLSARITSDPGVIAAAQGVVLPGVGAFGYAMRQLRDRDILPSLYKALECNRPFMGICLGFQLLFESSEEMGTTLGIGFLRGHVKPLSNVFATSNNSSKKTRSPVIGWIPVSPPAAWSSESAWSGTYLEGLRNGTPMYLVHSYYVEPSSAVEVLAEASVYGYSYCCSVQQGNLFGCQFHPEKSDHSGLQIYANFAKRVGAPA